MSFLFPAFLVGAALIALPIVLHLMRHDVAPEVPFPAVRLLRRGPIERSRRRRLRDLLLLAARVSALLLLAGAFARPYVMGATGSPPITVVAVDRSFSMSAPGTFDRALTLARQAIDDAGSRVAVVAFDQRADVVSPPGTRGEARAALASLRPGFGATRYAAAFDKAIELAESGPARLVIVSDLQRHGFDAGVPGLPSNVELAVRDAGTAQTNAAVTDLHVEGRRVVATIRNTGMTPCSGSARLAIDGRAIKATPFSLAPGAMADVPFELPAAAGGSLSVAIDDPGGYAADDVRYAVVESRAAAGVLVVGGAPGSPAGFYLTRALQASGEDAPGFAAHTMLPTAFARAAAGDITRYSTIGLLSTHGLDRRAGDTLRGFVNAGGGILIAAAPDVDVTVLSMLFDWRPELTAADRAGAAVFAATDPRHPIFQPFGGLSANLGQVSFTRTWDVRPATGWRVLARYTDGAPALLERPGRGRVLFFTSDLDRRWNDFPLHPSFVPFVQEAMKYLGGKTASPSTYLVSDVPAGVAPRPGIITLDDKRVVAVNVDSHESTIDRVDPAEFGRLVARTGADTGRHVERLATQVEAHQNYWRYGLMLMLVALAFESVIGRL
jgi:aerotolerance regulator-like protein/VWA domain-containing protein